jgi:hypothetical protein
MLLTGSHQFVYLLEQALSYMNRVTALIISV